jgi:hypothetical protein
VSFQSFTFPQVQHDLGLTVQDADLFADASPFPVRAEFDAFLRYGATLAVANSTEKAKSEFIIAPILVELRRSLGDTFSLFSGVEWDVDAERGLNGYCDFILAHGKSQHVLSGPFVAISEAKNDLIRTGLGQCIAAMYAAQLSNERAGTALGAVHGVVSTGTTWKFLRLQRETVTIDVPEYYVDNLPKIMGILRQIVQTP